MQSRRSQAVRWLKSCGLPLLAKELTEQSARKRTYLIRVVYATLLFGTALLMFSNELRIGAASSMAVLGKGRDLFMSLVLLQFGGIYLFMPAMTCSVVTLEKERASLQLLLLTRLGPWTILFEKLLGRVIPMLFFLLLSLPLLAFAYTLGGVTPATLMIGVALLVLAVVQMGTLALLCSAYCRTTVAAFIWSYLLGLLLFFGPALLWVVIRGWSGLDPSIWVGGRYWSPSWQVLLNLPLFGLGQFAVNMQMRVGLDEPLAIHAGLVLAQSAICLGLARRCLVRRAALPPRSVMLNLFRMLDRVFLKLNNNRVTKGVVFVRDSAALPDMEPVGWRETTRRSLGKAQYLARVFIGLEVPVAVLCFLCIYSSLNADPLRLLLALVWLVAILMTSVQAASLIAGERSHQTLDVLASTPLRAREIIRQKFQAVRRLMFVLCIPLLTIVGFSAAMRWRMPMTGTFWGSWQPIEFRLGVYLCCSLISILVYLPLVAWMSCYIGLRVKTQARAIVVALGLVLGWCVMPLIGIVMPLEIWYRPGVNSGFGFVALTTPVAIVMFNEEGSWRELLGWPWLGMILNFLWYGGWLFVFRWLCYRQADRYLGRIEVADELDEILSRVPSPRSAEPQLTQA